MIEEKTLLDKIVEAAQYAAAYEKLVAAYRVLNNLTSGDFHNRLHAAEEMLQMWQGRLYEFHCQNVPK